MPTIADYRNKFPSLRDLDDGALIDRVAEVQGVPREDVIAHMGYKPKSRNIAAVANDTVIETANALAGGVKSVADFVAPGNAVSQFIDENIIKPGEANQSNVVKGEKARYRSEMESADGIGDEIGSTLGYVGRNPLQSLAQAAGSFALPGAAVKGGGLLASLAGAGTKGIARGGLAGGAVAGAALSGGDAAGTAYELVKKAGGTEDEATEAARKASVLPAAIGAAGGVIGAERLLAGAGGFKGGMLSQALKTAGVEGAQEAVEEGVTQYEGQRAAMPYDASIDPMKGVAGAATMGAALGAATGGGVSLLTGKREQAKVPDVADVLAAPSIDDAIGAATAAISAPAAPALKPRQANAAAADELAMLDPADRAEALSLMQMAERQDVSGNVRRYAQNRLDELLAPVRQIPTGEVSEVLDAPLPTGEATELDMGELSDRLGRPSFTQRRMLERGIPAGEATELIPTGEATEEPEAIPTGEVSYIEPEAGMAPRRKTDGVALDLNQSRAVAGYVERMGGINTPAARAFVQDYRAGRITDDDVMGLIVPAKRAEPTPDERIAAAAAQAPKREVLPTDILTGDGVPYGSKTAANVRAVKEGLTPASVIEIPGAGWVVRPKEAPSVTVPDVPRTAGLAAGAADGRAPDGVGSGGNLRPLPDVNAGVRPAATAPEQRSGEVAPAGSGSQPNAALSEAERQRLLKKWPGVKDKSDESLQAQERWDAAQSRLRALSGYRGSPDTDIQQQVLDEVGGEQALMADKTGNTARRFTAEWTLRMEAEADRLQAEADTPGTLPNARRNREDGKRRDETAQAVQKATQQDIEFNLARVRDMVRQGRINEADAQRLLELARSSTDSFDAAMKLEGFVADKAVASNTLPVGRQSDAANGAAALSAGQRVTLAGKSYTVKDAKPSAVILTRQKEDGGTESRVIKAGTDNWNAIQGGANEVANTQPNSGGVAATARAATSQPAAQEPDAQPTASPERTQAPAQTAATQAERASRPAAPMVATHKDPGEPAEPVTPAVVREAIKTGVQATDRKPSVMKAELLAKIDEAVKDAPDYMDFQAVVKTMGLKDATAVFTDAKGTLGDKAAPQGYSRPTLRFKIEGDGVFTVNNTVRQLLTFRAKVEASPGFRDRQAPAGLNERATDTLDRRSADAAIGNMIEEGDFQAALDYAQAKGVDMANVKLTKVLRDRLDKWEQDQTSAKRMAEYEAANPPAPKPEPAPAPAAEPEADDIPEAGIASQTFEQWAKAQYAGNEYKAKYLEKFGGDEKRAILASVVGTIDTDRTTAELLKAAKQEYRRELFNLPRESVIALEVWDELDNMLKVEAQRHFYDLDARITRRDQDTYAAKAKAEREKKAPYEAAFAEVDAEIRRLDKIPGPETQKQKDLSARRSRLREAIYQIGQGKEPDGRLLRKEAEPAAPAPEAPAAAMTGPRRDPTLVTMFNPYLNGDIVTIGGKDWMVKQDTPGWYLTNTGNWRGEHPTIKAIKGMQDLIREVEQAATESEPAKPTPDLQTPPAEQAAAILSAAAEPPKGKERLDVLKDVKAGAITPEEVAAAYPAPALGAKTEAKTEEPAETTGTESLNKRHAIPKKQVLTPGGSLKADATNSRADSAVWYYQGDMGALRFTASVTVEGKADPRADDAKRMLLQIKAAQDAGWRRANYRAGSLGTVWVFERGDEFLTRAGMENAAAVEVQRPVLSENRAGYAAMATRQFELARAFDDWLNTLPEDQQDNRGVVVRKMGETPVGEWARVEDDIGGGVALRYYDKGALQFGASFGARNWPELRAYVRELASRFDKSREADENALYTLMQEAGRAANAAEPGSLVPAGWVYAAGRRFTGSVDAEVAQLNAAKDGNEYREFRGGIIQRPAERSTSAAPAVPTTPTEADADLWKKVTAGEATPDEFKAGFESWVSNKAAILADLSTKTKADLLKIGGAWFASRYKNDTKPEVVEALWRDGASAYTLGRSFQYGMGKDSYTNGIRRMVEATGADELAQFVADRKTAQDEALARVAKIAEAIKDPKTLADYNTWMRATMEGGKTFKEARFMLTPEQRAAYDDLAAESSRASRKVKQDTERTTVRAAGQTTAGEIIATKHTRDGHDLWVVKLSDRVSKDDYVTLLAGAKRLGGNYSSFRGNGAVPGFQFRTPDAAQAFLKLAGGDTAQATEVAQERRNAFEDDRSQSAAERLTEMADRLEERADESMGRDRKANTDRRARFAASAEAAASADKAMAKTMRNIASAITGGGAKFLDRVRQKVQVELLQGYIRSAQDAQLRAKYESYADQEKHKGAAPTFETADYAEFPTFTAYRSDLASLGRQLLEVDGTKKVGERIMKVADDVSDAFTAFVKEPGNFAKVATFRVRDTPGGIVGYSTKDAAERALARSGLKGKGIAYQVKRGQYTLILSPSEATARGIWKGDGDKRITLDPDFAAELVEKIGRASRRGAKVSVPWQFETAYDRRKTLARMGIESPAEFRAALREFIAMREQPAEADKIKALERAMVGRRNDGLDFFPTPEETADEMVAAADIQPGMRVLEPSAGMGHIAERIRAAGFEPDVGEFSNDRRELLEAKGFSVVSRDFMDTKARDFFTYGDTFKAPDGKVGVMRGLGGMGSDRVRLVVDGDERTAGYYSRSELEPVKRNNDPAFGLVPRADLERLEASRDFVRGDVLLSVRSALHFYDRGDLDGAATMLGRATRQAEFNPAALEAFEGIEERLRASAEGQYDRILMNPPFSDGRDIQHVRHAYDLLKPGGRLVAIMGEGAFFQQNKRATEFREWLESVGGTDEKLDDGTFNDPSLPVNTGANARMVVIDKPGAEPTTQFSRNANTRLGIPMKDATAVAQAIREALPTAPQILLHESLAQAPQKLQDAINAAGAANDVEAAYHDGAIHVFPQHMASVERMAFVVGHHEIRHHGLRSMLGPRLGPVLLGMHQGNANLRAAAQAKIDEGLTTSRVEAIEEALADMPLEELAKLNGWDKIVTAVRQWLRNLAAKLRRTMPNLADAIDPMSWTDRDVAAMVMRAENVSRGGSGAFRTGGTVFQRVWHGTPYRGIDKFSTDAIGTGEGAQAYGYGLYFASKREVADFYRRKLSGESDRVFTKDGKTISGSTELAEAYYQPGRIVRGYSGADKVLEFKRTPDYGWSVKVVGVKANGDPMSSERPRWHATQPDGNALRDVLEEDGWKPSQAGQLYEVEVPEDSELLHWDKPLSEQPAKVREAMADFAERSKLMTPYKDVNEGTRYRVILPGETRFFKTEQEALDAVRAKWDGASAYMRLAEQAGGQQAASKALAELGIKGIKYLDGTSRDGKGNGHNYVIFSGDDTAIKGTMFSRTTAGTAKLTAQDLVNSTGGVFDFNRMGESKQDRLRTVMDGSRPFWLGALTRDQIADIYGKDISPVKEYDQLTRDMENQRSKIAQDADDIYSEWAKLPAEENDKLARMMLDATVYSVHPDGAFNATGAPNDAERRQVHARLKAQYALMGKDAKAMYAKVRDFHLSTLTQLRDGLLARVDRQVENGAAKAAALTKIRTAFDAYLKEGPYFPLSRFGDFLVIANRAEDGERVVASYATAGEQAAAARTLEADGFTVKMKTAKTYSRETDGSAGKFIGDVLTTLDKLDMADATVGGDVADLKTKLMDDVNQLFIKALPDLSYRKHFMHRKGTPGFSSDMMRGFASSSFHAASHIARLNHGDKMTFALQDAYTAIEQVPEGDFNLHSQVLNELTKRHDAALNPNTHPIAAMLNQVGFVMYLGMSPAAGIINMLQTVMVTMPHLGARYGFGKANGSLAKALSDITTGAKANAKNGWNAAQSTKLTAAERTMMSALQDEGVIDLTQAHDLASATGLDTGNVARSKAAFAMARAMKIVGWTFHIPEVMNRQVTALSAYRLEMEKSGNEDAAKDAAREAIKRTHFDYSSSNRARFMQGNVARVMLQFKQYGQNMTYLLGRAAYQALKGESPEVRSIARRQLVATFGVTWAMAGTLGLPGIGSIAGLIGALVGAMDDDDEPWEWKVEFRNLMADTFGKEAGEVISHGIPRALMPWDISNRVSLGDLWWRDNGREGQNPREAFASDMSNILGPTAGTVLGLYTAADHMAKGHWSKATEAMVPKFLRDPLKALREGTEGVTSYAGEPLMDTAAAETMGRLLGFAPARASEMFEGKNAVMNAKTAIEQKRQALIGQMAKARIDKDAETVAELQPEIAAFNQRNPEFRITGATIAKATMTRMKNRKNTEDGILLPRTKQSLRDIGRFAEVE